MEGGEIGIDRSDAVLLLEGEYVFDFLLLVERVSEPTEDVAFVCNQLLVDEVVFVSAHIIRPDVNSHTQTQRRL